MNVILDGVSIYPFITSRSTSKEIMQFTYFISACAPRVTVLGLCVCLPVCLLPLQGGQKAKPTASELLGMDLKKENF